MFLVTGAGGKTGRAVVRALVSRGAPARVFVRSRTLGEQLLALGASEFFVGDLRNRSALATAMNGVAAVYHIAPNMHAEEPLMAQTAIATALRAGVPRFVFHSVLHPAIEAMPHHWRKMRAEEAVFASGLDWTILQPAAYLQNLLAGWTEILEEGEHRVPYPVTTRLSMVDLDDVAEVAATVLTEPNHEGAIYELAGGEVLEQTEVAACLSAALNRPVRAVEVPVDAWAEAARSRGLEPLAVDDLMGMFGYYAEHGLFGNPRVLQLLLGRPPTSIDEFLRRV